MVFENLYCTALHSIGHPVIIYKQPRVKLLKKFVLSHVTFYVEDDDHKAVNFNGETMRFFVEYLKYMKELNQNMIRLNIETEKLLF